MPDEETPADPFTAFAMAAAQIHEMFVAYLAVGFTEAQAMYLVAAAVTGGPKAPA